MSASEFHLSEIDDASHAPWLRDPRWNRLVENGGGILVVGHGTRNPIGASQLLELVSQMQRMLPSVSMEGCFLELATPTIEQTITVLAQQGIRQLVIVPILLFTANHAKEDIPSAVIAAARPHGIQVIAQSSPLGTHPAALALSDARYKQVLALERGVACAKGSCAKVVCPSDVCEGLGHPMHRVGLAMVGRGTSDQQALAHMREFTRLRVEQSRPVCFQTGFFAGGNPTVDELMAETCHWDCDTVVVQPHLLFEGELIEQLRHKVQTLQLQQSTRSNKRWFVPGTLGADRLLARVFLQLVLESLPENL